jgi:DNA-binding SARP family transcriptional activator
MPRPGSAPPPRMAPTVLGSVLQRLSDGIVVVDAVGQVLWWNRAAARRLAPAGPRAAALTCCALLGCEENTVAGGEARCLTRLALDSANGFAMRALRLPGGASAAGGWIAAHPLPAEGRALVAFELRLADGAGEQPRRGAPAPARPPARRGARGTNGASAERAEPAGPALTVAALGALRASTCGRRLDGDWLAQRPGQVFRYLLCARARPAPAEEVAGAIWPERGPEAIANVRYCMYKLRDQLDGRGRAGASLVLHSAAGYRLDPARLKLDVDVFQAEVTAGLAACHHGDREAAERRLGRALELYRGEFLADDAYAEWAFTERDHLRSLAGKALAALGELSLGEDRLGSAAVHLERLARLEPFDSHVHELLIEVCLRRGRRTDALRHYNGLRLRLLRAFGEEPEFDLADVAARAAESRPRAARPRARTARSWP